MFLCRFLIIFEGGGIVTHTLITRKEELVKETINLYTKTIVKIAEEEKNEKRCGVHSLHRYTK